jgi:hypothetical protein
MNEHVTPEKLLLYLYNETGMSDSVQVQRSIDSDPAIEEEFNLFARTRQLLDGIDLHASRDSIATILGYARLTQSFR